MKKNDTRFLWIFIFFGVSSCAQVNRMLGRKNSDSTSSPTSSPGATDPNAQSAINDTNAQVDIQFVPYTFNDILFVKSGNGEGSLSISGVSEPFCSVQCQTIKIPSATAERTITATASEGSVFDGWAGFCNGFDECVIPPGQTGRLIARFTRPLSLPTPQAGCDESDVILKRIRDTKEICSSRVVQILSCQPAQEAMGYATRSRMDCQTQNPGSATACAVQKSLEDTAIVALRTCFEEMDLTKRCQNNDTVVRSTCLQAVQAKCTNTREYEKNCVAARSATPSPAQ